MWWTFSSVFFLGSYSCLLALMGSFEDTGYLELECKGGVQNQAMWEAGNGVTEVYLAMQQSIIIVSTTCDYFVYFSIPYRLNRIMKT